MDIEHYIDKTIAALNDSDVSQWKACYWIWEASQSGYSKWAELIGLACGIGDDQARNRANAWNMYLLLLDDTNQADGIQDSLYFSHFVIAYKYYNEYEIFDTMFQAVEEGLSARKYAGFLDSIYGDDPASRYASRLGRFGKELAYIYGLSEANHVSQRKRRAMMLLKGRLNE